MPGFDLNTDLSVVKTGTADMSDFGKQTESRVYDDACDTGFNVCSPRTGTVKLFTLDAEHVNGDELTHRIYRSTDGYTITLFND